MPNTAEPWGSRAGRSYASFDRGPGGPGRREASVPVTRFGSHGGMHISCLLEEAVREMLPDKNVRAPRPDGTYDGLYVDCTFGRGGHTREILKHISPAAQLISFDVDPEAIQHARLLENEDARFKIAHRPFAELGEELGDRVLDGITMDLGVSSPQLDVGYRGFSVTEEAELDLRMNQSVGIPAWKWLETAPLEEIAWVIHNYGEDGDAIISERIAYAIKARIRYGYGMRTTRHLADLVRKVKKGVDERGQHPAKLTFQAIRIHLNQEMDQLESGLTAAMEKLVDGGKCTVIIFKKKEQNAVMNFVRRHEEPYETEGALRGMDENRFGELFPCMASDLPWCVELARDAVKPSEYDRQENPRTRSAMVFVLRKRIRVIYPKPLATPRPDSERFVKPTDKPTFAGLDSNRAASTQGPGAEGHDEWRHAEPGSRAPPAPRPSAFPPPRSSAAEAPPSRTSAANQQQQFGQSTAGPPTAPSEGQRPAKPVTKFPEPKTSAAPEAQVPRANGSAHEQANGMGRHEEFPKSSEKPVIAKDSLRFPDGRQILLASLEECRVLQDLAPPQMSFKKGQILRIIQRERDNMWAYGLEMEGLERGWFLLCKVRMFQDI